MKTPYEELLDEDVKKEIARLTSKEVTDEYLYMEIGMSLGAPATGEPPGDRGKKIVQRRLSEIRQLICSDKKIMAYCSDANVSDTTTIAVAIVGGLTASSFAGLNLVLVGCLVARIGLRTFCEVEWASKN